MTLNERLGDTHIYKAMEMYEELGFIFIKDNDHTHYNNNRQINIEKEDIKMKRYKVIDLYEGYDVIGYADTLAEVKAMAKEYYMDTDGECDINFMQLNEKTQNYNRNTLSWIRGC